MGIAKQLLVWSLLLLSVFGRVNGMGDGILELCQRQGITEYGSLQKNFSKLLMLIKMEFLYAYTALWRKHLANDNGCIFDLLIKEVFEGSSLVIHTDHKRSGLSGNQTEAVLTMSCWNSVWSADKVKLIFGDSTYSICHLIWIEDLKDLGDVCALVANVASFRHLIVDRMSMETQVVHACNQGKIMEGHYHSIRRLLSYSNRYMVGLPIVTESDQLPPRSILYYGSDGSLQLEGFVGNCVKTFAERHGAKLIIRPPLKMRIATYYGILENKTLEGLLDLPAAISPMTAYKHYSYPLELLESCYMIPLPRLMETNEVFTYIIEVNVMLIILLLSLLYGILLTIGTQKRIGGLSLGNVVLNDKAIRVLLGQSFVMPVRPCFFMQYICFLVCYTSIIINTTYEAYLQSHFTHPSLQQRVESYADIEENRLKIKISSQELNYIDASIYTKYRHLFEIMNNFDDFLKLRASMDVRYVYPVSKTRWEVFNQQQKFFQRPLFYYSQNLCLKKLTLLSIPLRPDLPYTELFNQHLHDVRDTGLLQYWVNDNFYAMVRLNYMRFDDLSTPEQYADPIELDDFKWIWILYGAFLALASIVFMGEVIHHHIFLAD